MNVFDFFSSYTKELLAWNLGPEPCPSALPENPEKALKSAARMLRMARLGSKPWILLLGAGDGTTAGILARDLPDDLKLIILESDPYSARKTLQILPPKPNVAILADSSPFALHLLLIYAGIKPEECVMGRNRSPDKNNGETLEKFEKLFIGGRETALPDTGGNIASSSLNRLSIGCILHPDEQGLDIFFSQFPRSILEVVAIWDCESLPAGLPGCAAPARHLARPLGGNFSAQRNAMLRECRGDFCFYLDADEILPPEVWPALAGLIALPGFSGAFFPRLTFEKDNEHVRMGHGLWPDPQLRLFSLTDNREGIKFTGSVHERLAGLHGAPLIVPGAGILHFSHIRKDRAALEARLRVFDKAAGRPLHKLSASYPCLPLEFFTRPAQAFGLKKAIVLPVSF